MGIIKTLTIGGEKYDIAADVKLASCGGLSKNSDGEIGVYTGSGLYIGDDNHLNVLLQDNGGLGVGVYGLFVYNNIPFSSETIKWGETAYILGQYAGGYAYGVRYDWRAFYSDYTYGLQLQFNRNDFELGDYGLQLTNPSGGIVECNTNYFQIGNASGNKFSPLDCFISEYELYTNLKLSTSSDPSDPTFLRSTQSLLYEGKSVPGFGYNKSGFSIYLLSYSWYGTPYLPLGFNNNGAICIHTSTQDSPGGSPAGAFSALQGEEGRVFINLYTLARQLTNFMEIRDGQLIYKFDREI